MRRHGDAGRAGRRQVAAVAVLIELGFLSGRDKLGGAAAHLAPDRLTLPVDWSLGPEPVRPGSRRARSADRDDPVAVRSTAWPTSFSLPRLTTRPPPRRRRADPHAHPAGADRHRTSGSDPVLEPLFRVVRNTHPKADLAIVEKAYKTAEKCHGDQTRRSGDPYITHPLAVTTILAELGMTPPTLCAALLHDTVEDTAYTLDAAARRLRRRGRAARRRRHQARQGQLRRLRAGRDDPQDDRRDEQGHPGPGHQARRPAAQHAHAALPPAGDPGADRQRDPRDLRPAGPPARHEHDQVGARGPRVRHPAPQGLRRDRPAGRRARAGARRVPGHGDRPGAAGPARRRRSRPPSPAGRSTTTRSTRR